MAVLTMEDSSCEGESERSASRLVFPAFMTLPCFAHPFLEMP
jgi:hypothetical protein